MAVLAVSNLKHAYGNAIVLDGATLSIETGEKIGLVGRNGTGKTTLMKAMLGVLAPDEGSVQLQRGARIGYLSQDPQFDAEENVRDAAEGAFEELHRLHQEAHAIYERMATAEGETLDRLLRQQVRIESEIEAAGGYAIDHRIDATLHGLRFTDEELTQKTGTLSGGQKGRLGLARLLLESPDLLLLDEPTNHLDIAGRQWLEEFLAEEYAGAVLVVSHDRWLLDRVVDRIVEIEDGVIYDYPGSYHKYVELRSERKLTQARQHDKQRDHVRREKQFIARYKSGQRAKQARGRESRLERFKTGMVDRPAELDVMNLSLPSAGRSGDMVIAAEGIGKAYGDKTLFEQFDLEIRRGERIGIIGPNGVGKTTLIRCLLGDLEPDSGSVRHGSRLSVGYYRQLHEHLDLSLTVWQYLQSVIVSLDGGTRASEQQARDLAGAFLFSGNDQDKTLGDLSGGERSRVVLAGLVAGAHNLLVLDEPSNHLDIPAAERLEAALSPGGYDGTLIMISHDRALLQATCDRLIVFEDGVVRSFPGTYRDWLERRVREAADARAAAAQTPAPRPKATPAPKKTTVAAAGGDTKLARLSNEHLEERIEEIEGEIASIDSKMLDPKVYTDGDRCRALRDRRAELQGELGPIESEWTRRAEEA